MLACECSSLYRLITSCVYITCVYTESEKGNVSIWCICIAASVIKARMSSSYLPGSCAARFSVVKKKQEAGGLYVEPQSTKASNPCCFLLQISLLSHCSSLLLCISAIHTEVTRGRLNVRLFMILSKQHFIVLCGLKWV